MLQLLQFVAPSLLSVSRNCSSTVFFQGRILNRIFMLIFSFFSLESFHSDSKSREILEKFLFLFPIHGDFASDDQAIYKTGMRDRARDVNDISVRTATTRLTDEFTDEVCEITWRRRRCLRNSNDTNICYGDWWLRNSDGIYIYIYMYIYRMLLE